MKSYKIIAVAIVIVGLLGAGGYLFLVKGGTEVGSNSQTTTTASNQAIIDAIPKSGTEQILDSYQGDEHDRYYLANMIAHHQGALDMAKLAETNASHTEIKQLATTITTTQTSEISSMTQYQKDWGYPASSGAMMEDHSGMHMSEEMTTMNAGLTDLKGEAFDKKFLELMIEHHQSAISMSRPAKKNAGHKEIKTLAEAIITAQSKEIAQMQQWQKDWGYTN